MRAARDARGGKWPWEIIIFDVDGVLVDARESYQRTVLQTVQYFTGERVGRSELHEWKNRPGFNDDWTLTHAWVKHLGGHETYEEVKEQFESFHWGKVCTGNVARERWMLPHGHLRRLSRRATLAIFTGRTHRELKHTLDRFRVRRYFSHIITVESILKPKPEGEGLLRILDGRTPAQALYLGDNIDDALATRNAGVAFIGVLPRRSTERRIRAARLRELGARTILGEVIEIEEWLDRQKLQPQK